MSARRKARKRALDVLYAAESRSIAPLEMLAERLADADAPPFGDFAANLVRGVSDHGRRIDDLVATHLIDWTIDRLPAVDRAILRIAVFEILRAEVDAAVVIDEAVELAKTLSTDDSPRFVNGVLSPIAAIAPRLQAARPDEGGDGEGGS